MTKYEKKKAAHWVAFFVAGKGLEPLTFGL